MKYIITSIHADRIDYFKDFLIGFPTFTYKKREAKTFEGLRAVRNFQKKWFQNDKRIKIQSI